MVTINAMHEPRKLLPEWSIKRPKVALWQMPCLRTQQTGRMGDPPDAREAMPRHSHILHSDVRSGTLPRAIVKKARSAVCEALAQELWYPASVFYLRRVRLKTWAPPLSRNILWREDDASKAHRKKVAKEYVRNRRSEDRRHMGPRVDLFKGLRLVDGWRKHNSIYSGICREKRFERERHRIQGRMGPPVEASLYWISGSEAFVRSLYHKNRLGPVFDVRNSAWNSEIGWETDEDTVED